MGEIVKEQNYDKGELSKTVHIDVKINGWKDIEFRKRSRTILQKKKLHSAITLEKTIHVFNGWILLCLMHKSFLEVSYLLRPKTLNYKLSRRQ